MPRERYKSSTVRLLSLGKIVDQRNLLRRRKGVHDRRGNYSLFAKFPIRRSQKIVTSLCGVWWYSNTIYMARTFPKVKKSSFKKHPLSQKKKLTLSPLTQNRTKQILILQCNNQAIALQLLPSLYPMNALSQLRTTWS